MDLTSPFPFRHQREPHMPKPLEIPATALPRKLEDTERVMEPHPRSNSLPTSTPPPRSPLPPHKLAKLANALGVNTPMPAFYRSPSPGTSSFRTPSRYLLHIVPPVFLPSEEDDDGSDPDGASAVSASSYRSQFRRGTLIPLYPSLQSQLGAIAREYNLPSTGGLVLYLVQSSQDGALDGPRISDDVWKLLWHKALQAERQDSQPRTTSALNLRSGRSTPSSPFNNRSRDHSQSFSSSSRVASSPFPYPSPSTSSTPSSEVHLPLSAEENASTADLLSVTSDFTPNPFLPILAKIEFDIDRRKASWYDAWAHGRRERSRWRGTTRGKIALELPEHTRSRERNKFRTGVSTPSEESSEYAILDDGEGDNTAVDEDEQDQDQETVVLRHRDPLADVFGNDAATWDEMHAGRQGKPGTGLGVIAPYPELVMPPGDEDPETRSVKVRDEEEVVKLWDENQRPTLSLNPPDPRASPRKGAPPPLNLIAVPDSMAPLPSPGLATSKSSNSILPYLDGLSPSDSSSSASEKYGDKRARRRTGMVFGDLEVKVVAEPEEMTEEQLSHRSSQIVMKHKLDQLEKQLAQLSPRQLSASPTPTSSDVPEDSQENDRPVRSAPPGVDKFTLSPRKHTKGSHSPNASSHRPDSSNTSTPLARQVDDPFNQFPPRKDSLNAVPHPRSPRSQEHKRSQGSQSSSGSSSKPHPEQHSSGTVWPSVAYTSLPNTPVNPSSSPPRPNGRLQDRSPPQLTLKRASVGQRKPAIVDMSEETRARALDEGQDILLPGALLPGNPNDPVIPLSPDPFGKRPVEDLRQTRLSDESTQSTQPTSAGSRPPSRLQGTVLPASVPEYAELDTNSSRFSADSEQGVEHLSKQRRSRTNSIMSVRGLRSLWRKSNAPGKGSGSGVPPIPAELSPSLPSPRPSSQHSRGESTASQRSTRPPTERPRRPSAAPRPDSGSDPFQFDNSNIYKSASSSSLASAATSPLPPGQNYASVTGSIGQSKGILKGWTGNANPSDAEARRMRQSGIKRSMSTTSASMSDLDDPSADFQQSSPPSSPPDVRRASIRRKQTSSPSIEPMLLSHSLPTTSAPGLSRYPEALPSGSSASFKFGNGSTPHLSEFEIVSPPSRSTPSSSYTGEVF